MLRNKDHQLAALARAQSENIAIRSDNTNRAARQLRTTGQDFAQWVNDMPTEQMIRRLPNLIARLDYIYPRAVDVQNAAAETVLKIHAIRETLEKLATRAINREKEEAREC